MYRLIKSNIKSFIKKNTGWSGDYSSWQAALEKCGGYNAANILEKVKEAILKVKNGEAVYERDSVIFDKVEYSYPLLASLMWVAAKNMSKLSVMDFGGSLGSTYFQNKRFLDDLYQVHWNIIEQPNFVECGRQFIQDHIVKFYPAIEEATRESIADILIISCALQYIEKPYELIQQITSYKIPYIVIDNTPFNFEIRDRLTIQKVPPSIYNASYPCWFLNYEAVLQAFSEKYSIVNEHQNDAVIELDGRKVRYKGCLMELKNQTP